MADRFDGRLAVRPASDRSLSEMNQPEKSNADPLFELARIVSGQGRERRNSGLAASSRGSGRIHAGSRSGCAGRSRSGADERPSGVVPGRERRDSAESTAAAGSSAAGVPTPQVAKAPEGVVRERLTDALAALAPVIKLDRTPGIAMPGSGSAQQTAARAAVPQRDESDLDVSAANAAAVEWH